MRKFSLILVIFVLTAPAWAVVTISVEPNEFDDSFNIVYDVSEGENVRAFALDIFVDDDINIVEVNDYHVGESTSDAPGYGIFPSNFASEIDPEDPEWDDEEYTPLGNEADYPSDTLGGLDTNGITVELGALYVGDNNDPCDSGKLLGFDLESGDVNHISLALNQIRGGVVLEDPNDPVVVELVGWTRCLVGGNAGVNEHAYWVAWNRPDCWCYCRQCRGDSDGKATFGKWVAVPDLTLLKQGFGKNNTDLAQVPNGICGDFDHKPTFGKHVAVPDLTILKTYFLKLVGDIPRCDSPTVITGPYNFWVIPPGSSCP